MNGLDYRERADQRDHMIDFYGRDTDDQRRIEGWGLSGSGAGRQAAACCRGRSNALGLARIEWRWEVEGDGGRSEREVGVTKRG